MAYVHEPSETADTRADEAGPGFSLEIVGSYDDAPGPVQMAAVHRALIVYYGTENWLEERNKRMPGFYGCIRTTE